MDNPKNEGDQDPKETPEITEEEQAVEEDALKESSEDEIKGKVIEDLGLDAEIDKDIIDKIVTDKKETQKKLQTAIKQKRTWRDKAKTPKEEVKETPPQPKVDTDEDIINKRIDERFEERDLNSLDISDDLKKDVKSYATLNKVSIQEALKSDYIQFKKKSEDDAKKSEEASLGTGGGVKTGKAKKEYSKINPTKDFDLSTPEGREDLKEYTEWLKGNNPAG